MPYLLPLAVPLCFLLTALAATTGPQMRPRRVLALARWLSLLAFVFALASGAVLIFAGSGEARLGQSAYLLSLRLDVVSLPMLVLVAFIGWIVTGFSATYLDGEARQRSFTFWMALTLASVSFFILSGSLAVLVVSFIATSLCLHQLLLFYPERPAARRAAWKKFIVSRVADAALVVAAVLLWFGYGTADIAEILAGARAGLSPPEAVAAAALLAVAALIKSAQFPTHGWLVEVMETPTPVSALLHAGVVNAGGYLLIRFVDVMLLSPLTLAMLVMIGALTAIFGSLVMLTQSAVKTSLAWSTVAQMGFMILQCGLTLFPVALLHIIAHSLYKAHAFLSSGSAVEATLAVRRPGPVATPNVRAVLRAFLLALVIYALAGLAFGFWHKPPQALALGAILIFGVAYLIAQGLADAAPWQLTWRTSLIATAAAVSYFALQWAAYALTAGVLPPAPEPGALVWALIILSLLTFGFTAFAQSLFPLWAHHPAVAGLRVHLQNGLYVNALFDRMLGNFNTVSPAQDRM
jgi:NAD(P)H-quinone oxidoreductase subunit 5